MSEDIPQPRSQSVAHWAVNERLNHIQYILLLKAEKEHSFETFPSKEMKLKYWRLKGSPLGKMTAYLTLNSSPTAQFAGCFFLTLVLFFGLIHTLDSIFPVYLKALLKTCFSPCLRDLDPEGVGVALSRAGRCAEAWAPWLCCVIARASHAIFGRRN